MPIVESCEPEVNVIDVKLEQPQNTASPIDVTEAGIVIDVNLEQLVNALLPIVRSCESDENVTDVKLVQPQNTFSPIVLTEAGIMIDVKFVQL